MRLPRTPTLIAALLVAVVAGVSRADEPAPKVEEIDRRATWALWLALSPDKEWKLADVADDNVRRLDQFRIHEASGRRAWGVTYGVDAADGSGRGYYRIAKHAGLPSLGEGWRALSADGASPQVLVKQTENGPQDVVVRSDEGSIQLSVMHKRSPGERLRGAPDDLLVRYRRLHAAASKAGLIGRLRLSARFGGKTDGPTVDVGAVPVLATLGETETRLALHVVTEGTDGKPVADARHAVRLRGASAADARIEGASVPEGTLRILPGAGSAVRDIEIVLRTPAGLPSSLHADAATGTAYELSIEVVALLGAADARSFEQPDVRESGAVRFVAWEPMVTRFKLGITDDDGGPLEPTEVGPAHEPAWRWLAQMARVRGPKEAYAASDVMLSGWIVIPPRVWDRREGPDPSLSGFRVRPNDSKHGITVLYDVAGDGTRLPDEIVVHFGLLASLGEAERNAKLPFFRVEEWSVTRTEPIDHLTMGRAALGPDRLNAQQRIVGGGAQDAPWQQAPAWRGTLSLPAGVHQVHVQATVVGRVSEAEPDTKRIVRVAARVAAGTESTYFMPAWGPAYAPR